MDFREFSYFVTIAEEANLTRAAEKLYVSQPALTKFIQRLEKELDLTLFSRNGRQLNLTYAGERYLSYAKQMLRVREDFTQELSDLRKQLSGVLRIGMPPFRCSFSIPAILPEFRKKFPKIKVEITEDSSSHLDLALQTGDIDLAFFNLAVPLPDLAYKTLSPNKVYAILSADHAASLLADTAAEGCYPRLSLHALKDEVFILQETRQRQGAYMLRELQSADFTPKEIQITSNIRAAASLAAHGYGVAFLSDDLLHHFTCDCPYQAYELSDLRHPFPLVAAWRKHCTLPDYANAFISMMEHFAADTPKQ